MQVQQNVIYNSQDMETTYTSINRWMDKEDVGGWECVCVCVCVCVMEYYSAIKNNDILPFVITWLDLESITLSEISQTLYAFPYM